VSESNHKETGKFATSYEGMLGAAFMEAVRQVVREELQALQKTPSNVQTGVEQLLDVEGLAKALGVKPTWIYAQTGKKADPRKNDLKDQPIPHLRVGRYPRFELSKVKAWMEARQKNSQSC
jgi:predicted DNA-binding transcriptional regulator AlpA